MRPFFLSHSTSPSSPSSTHSSHFTSSSTSRKVKTHSTMTWSMICSFIILNSFLSILSPFTAGGRALAALEPGFCGDCQTFANAIGVCGGSFGPADIEVSTEYVLQQQYAKCICTDVMQKVLWTCAKCEFLAGHGSKAPPPQKYQTQCIAWGVSIQDWKAPYTGVVAPGTQTDVGGGANPPPPPPASSTNQPTTKPSQPPASTSASGSGSSGTTSSNSASPTSPSDNSSSNSDKITTGGSSPNTAAIGISVGIIGVAVVAGAVAVVMMKRRRRRRAPLDLDSLPGQGAGFSQLEDKWSPHRPQSPPLPPAPIASATPSVARGGGHRSPYDNHGYMEGSVVGGYDGPYDGYDQYRGGGPYNNGYGQGQYHNQYDNYGSYEQEGYSHHDYNGGYDQGSQAPTYHSNTTKNEEPAKYL